MKVYVELNCPCGAQVDNEFQIDTSGVEYGNDIEHFEQMICDACTKDFTVQFNQYRGNRQVTVNEVSDFIYHIEDTSELETDWVVDTPISTHLEIFSSNMREVNKLLSLSLSTTEHPLLVKMLFTQTVTVLETYLSSVITHTILNSERLLRQFVQTDNSLSQKKMKFGELFAEIDKVKTTVSDELQRRVYHNLGAVEALLNKSLGLTVQFNASFHKAVNMRHHFTHRNGYDLDGNRVEITEADVVDFITQMVAIVADIDQQIKDLST